MRETHRICSDCDGGGWVPRADMLLQPGAHPEYPDGYCETWWEPCDACNVFAAGTRRVPEPPDEETLPAAAPAPEE